MCSGTSGYVAVALALGLGTTLVCASASAEQPATADLFDPIAPTAGAAEERAERVVRRIVSTCFIESWGHPWSDADTTGACIAAEQELDALGSRAVAAAASWLNDRRVPPLAVVVLLDHLSRYGEPRAIVPLLITAMERWSQRTQDTLPASLSIDRLQLTLQATTRANPTLWIEERLCYDPYVEGSDCGYYQGYRQAGQPEIDAWKKWWGLHQNETPAQRKNATLAEMRALARSPDPKQAFVGARWLLFEGSGPDQHLAKAALDKIPEEVAAPDATVYPLVPRLLHNAKHRRAGGKKAHAR